MKPVIIVHGGAGRIRQAEVAPRLDGCRAAALAGWHVLQAGGSALDAAEAAVVILEDNSLFNAGTGSTLNRLGFVEMDAAMMEGSSLRAGAVAAISSVKNPIRLARRVLEDGRHVLLVADGAARFAREAGFAECDPASLISAAEQKRWEEKHGTVGCVALDSSGRLAAATSTGGTFDKLPGRVGDSPLPGCGTYAADAGAASCTGDGEAIIRVVMAKAAVDLLDDGSDPQAAARQAVDLLAVRTGGAGGLIIVDRSGRIGYARNTERMPVCWIDAAGEVNLDN